MEIFLNICLCLFYLLYNRNFMNKLKFDYLKKHKLKSLETYIFLEKYESSNILEKIEFHFL